MDTMSFSHQTARLSPGRHMRPEDGVCVMELASVLAGQRFTDRPWSASPLITDLLQGYNDGLDDDRRQTLKRFAASVVDTAAGGVTEYARSAQLRAFIAERHPGRSPWTALMRHFRAGAPYTFAYGIARRVSIDGDERLHHRMVELLDQLVEASARKGRASAPIPEACPHHCEHHHLERG
jgi:hypothetical protein